MAEVDRGERVDLRQHPGHRRVMAWTRGPPHFPGDGGAALEQRLPGVITKLLAPATGTGGRTRDWRTVDPV